MNDQSELGHGKLKSPTSSKFSRTVSSSDEYYPAKATKTVANAPASFVARSKEQAAEEATQKKSRWGRDKPRGGGRSRGGRGSQFQSSKARRPDSRVKGRTVEFADSTMGGSTSGFHVGAPGPRKCFRCDSTTHIFQKCPFRDQRRGNRSSVSDSS